MDRKWNSGASGTPPASADNSSDGYATAGTPGTGVPATKPGPYWFHMVTEELLAVVTAAGITFDKTVLTQLRDAIKALIAPSVVTITATGTQHNLALTMPASRRLTVRCTNASLLTITGISCAAQTGDVIDFVAAGSQVDCSHNNSGSTVGNRLSNHVTSCVTSIVSDGSGCARYVYDGTSQIWRLLAHEQGAWIASSISTCTSTGGGGTLGAPSLNTNRYRVVGRTLQWSFYLGITPTGTVNGVNLALPIAGASIASSANAYAPMVADSAASFTQATATGAQGATTLTLEYKNNAGTIVALGGGSNSWRGQVQLELA